MKARIFSLFVLLVTLALTLILTWAVAAQGPQPDGLPLQLPLAWDRDSEQPFRPSGPWPAAAGPGLTPAEAQNVELVGQIGGATYAVAVQGVYAYVGVGPRLVILDVSDPAQPTVAGQTGVLPDIVWGVAVAGSYAYVAGRHGGLVILRYVAGPPLAPRFTIPCGTTNRTAPALRGLAYPGSTVSLYLDGSFVLSDTLPGTTFAFTPTLSAGSHTFTATATTPDGTGPASTPLALTVSPWAALRPTGHLAHLSNPGRRRRPATAGCQRLCQSGRGLASLAAPRLHGHSPGAGQFHRLSGGDGHPGQPDTSAARGDGVSL
jgi:hypothetical protein